MQSCHSCVKVLFRKVVRSKLPSWRAFFFAHGQEKAFGHGRAQFCHVVRRVVRMKSEANHEVQSVCMSACASATCVNAQRLIVEGTREYVEDFIRR